MRHPLFLQILGIAALVLCLGIASAKPPSHNAFDRVLKKHVENGAVDYAALQNDRQLLDDYIATMGGISKTEFTSWHQHDQLAFLINLYNAETLQLIIDHYPVGSIKDIGSVFSGPWSKDVVKLFGKQTTLNFLEHEFIRKRYKEPRIHYALVCAAISCPQLRDEAYTGKSLEAQFASQARTFLSNDKKNRVDIESKTLYISRIFDWYGDDFRKGNSTLIGSLKPYFPAPIRQKIDSSFKVRFITYDWRLNEKGATL